jgi:hypothetical protein
MIFCLALRRQVHGRRIVETILISIDLNIALTCILVAFSFYNTSNSIADMVAMGQLTHIGAHGEPPLGFNYHAEMGFANIGGLSNYEVCLFIPRCYYF